MLKFHERRLNNQIQWQNSGRLCLVARTPPEALRTGRVSSGRQTLNGNLEFYLYMLFIMYKTLLYSYRYKLGKVIYDNNNKKNKTYIHTITYHDVIGYCFISYLKLFNHIVIYHLFVYKFYI